MGTFVEVPLAPSAYNTYAVRMALSAGTHSMLSRPGTAGAFARVRLRQLLSSLIEMASKRAGCCARNVPRRSSVAPAVARADTIAAPRRGLAARGLMTALDEHQPLTVAW